MTIDYRHLRRIDLNLVVALHALVEERSVSKAAKRLNLGQPATSHLLRRLREHFDDEILVRSGADMVPTPRARVLAERLSEGLNLIDVAIQDVQEFDPARSAQDFRIAMSDSLEISLGAPLWLRMAEQAPHCRLRIANFHRARVLDRLDANELDVAVGVITSLRSWHAEQVLFEEGYVGLTAVPFATSPPALEDYVARRHLLVSQPDHFHGRMDGFLAQAGVSRRVVLSTSRFHAIPYFLKGTDAVTLLPTRVGEDVAARFGLSTFRLPLPVPAYEVRMVWHRRNHDSSRQRWLRRTIAEVAGTTPTVVPPD